MGDFIASALIGAIIIALIVFILLIVGIAKVFTFGTFCYMVAFIVLKMTGTVKISWWWILLGLLIPF